MFYHACDVLMYGTSNPVILIVAVTTRNILDCDQFNVLLVRIIFSCTLITVFISFFHTANDVIGHVTIRIPGVNFLSVVHSDHVSI